MAFFMHFYGLKKLAWLSLFMHKYTKNAGIVLFYTQNPAYLSFTHKIAIIYYCKYLFACYVKEILFVFNKDNISHSIFVLYS